MVEKRYQPKRFTPGEYNQLVGNKIPDLVKKDGLTPVTHRASDIENMRDLTKQLTTCSQELFSGDACDIVERMARIRLLLDAAEDVAGITSGQVESYRDAIESKEGSFLRRIILERVEEK